MDYKFNVYSSQDNINEILEGFKLIRPMYPELPEKQIVSLIKQTIDCNVKWVLMSDPNGNVLGVCSFNLAVKLYVPGKFMHLETFCVDPKKRSIGLGSKLLGFLEQHAKKLGCKKVMLDSYVNNYGSHKFYFREGYTIRGYHFDKDI